MEDWKAEREDGSKTDIREIRVGHTTPFPGKAIQHLKESKDPAFNRNEPPTNDYVQQSHDIDLDDKSQQQPQTNRVSISGGGVTKAKRNSSFSNPHRLSIVENDDDNWSEPDATLRNAKETAYTLLEKECAADDVIRVWECISKFIVFKMMEGKAVRVPGLGTFTFRIHKTPLNQKTITVTKAPIFVLSEYVSQMYRLKQDKVLISNVPEVPLALSVIANDTKMSRGLIEGIVTEILQAFARGIVCNKSLEFPIPFIGKLQIKNQKANMRFYEEFCKKLGFHVVETFSEANLLENMIQGRMTPLRLHIPTESFRSVFHLREVRSVHENPLLVPLVEVEGKLFPETLVDGIEEGEENEGEDDTNKKDQHHHHHDRKTKAVINLMDLNDSTINIADIDNEDSNMMINEMKKVVPAKPIYEPQKTGDCILDLMNTCPEIMLRCLRSHMYKGMIESLGTEVVKSHFRRRGNNCLVRDFSFDNLKLNQSDGYITISKKLN